MNVVSFAIFYVDVIVDFNVPVCVFIIRVPELS